MEAQSSTVARAALLFQQGRKEEAAVLFKAVLSENPEDAYALYMLALCQHQLEDLDDALRTIELAIGLEPELSLLHAQKALTLLLMDKPRKARKSAEHALELEPEDVEALKAMALIYVSDNRWSEAERFARTALQIEPDDAHVRNLMAIILRSQGRVNEAAEFVEASLADDADDSYAHANMGWNALRARDLKGAEKHFLEALRLDADNEYARSGLVDAFKARSFVFRLHLRYTEFIQKFSSKQQIVLFVLLIFFVKSVKRLNPVWGGVAVVCYLFFAFWSWTASGIANFLISFDRTARHALTAAEKREGRVVGFCLISGLSLLLAGGVLALSQDRFASRSAFALSAGAALMISIIPACMVFTNRSLIGRVLFGAVVLYAWIGAFFYLVLGLAGRAHEPYMFGWVVIELIAVAVGRWLANFGLLRH